MIILKCLNNLINLECYPSCFLYPSHPPGPSCPGPGCYGHIHIAMVQEQVGGHQLQQSHESPLALQHSQEVRAVEQSFGFRLFIERFPAFSNAFNWWFMRPISDPIPNSLNWKVVILHLNSKVSFVLMKGWIEQLVFLVIWCPWQGLFCSMWNFRGGGNRIWPGTCCMRKYF